jgi:hypothetical protein
MRRTAVLIALLAAAFASAASAAVVERLAPSLEAGVSPVPVFSMTGPVTASFVPALTPTLTAASLTLSPLAPAPALLPALPAPSAEPRPIPVAQSEAAFAPSSPVSRHDARGPPASAAVAKTVADTVRDWAVPVEDILSNHDALLLGENHGSLTSVDILAREMPRLAAAGVTAVGIEGLKRPNQQAVDDFLSGKTADLPEGVLNFSPKRISSFRALLESARTHGVRVVALGLPLDGWAREAAELAAANTGRPLNSFPNTVDGLYMRAGEGREPGFNEAVAEVFLTRRNRTMAGFLKDALKVGGKAVVLVGQAHVDGLDMVPGRLLNAPGDWGTLTRELGSLALDAYSLTMTGGIFTSYHDARNDRDARPASYRKASEASPKGAAAFVELGPGRALWHAGGTVLDPDYAH